MAVWGPVAPPLSRYWSNGCSTKLSLSHPETEEPRKPTIQIDELKAFNKERREGRGTLLLNAIKHLARKWKGAIVLGDAIPDLRGSKQAEDELCLFYEANKFNVNRKRTPPRIRWEK